mmetsp:Transcript_102101/g.181346  ORF Transcript_102101/g.181346 Transcript_102101/m.181346 type:complete len:98 (-) Transcript_102101:268-561(-)
MVVPMLLPAGVLGGVLAAKAGRNYLTSSEKNEKMNTKQTRDNSVVDRLLAGSTPPVSFWSEQQLERALKTNSAMQIRAHELREAQNPNRFDSTLMGA